MTLAPLLSPSTHFGSLAVDSSPQLRICRMEQVHVDTGSSSSKSSPAEAPPRVGGAASASASKRRHQPDAAPPKRQMYHACDACRYRRVKCERDDPEQPCKGCTKRGFVCRKDYNAAKAKTSRASRRLVEAEALFGSGTPAPADSLEVSPIPSATEVTIFAYDSAESRLGSVQSSEFTVNSLIHGYRDLLLHQNPLIHSFEQFLARFEVAGRRFSQLDVADKATASVIMALAARVTDLPLIAGSRAASLLPNAVGGMLAHRQDLMGAGFERESVCRQLEQRARSCVEQRFAFPETPSIDSISALLATQSIRDIDDPHSFRGAPRLYSAAAIEQLRALANRQAKSPEVEAFLEGSAVRGLLVTDAMFGWMSGRRMQISRNDLILIRPRCLTATPIAAIKAAMRPFSLMGMILVAEQMVAVARSLRQEYDTSVVDGRQHHYPDKSWFQSILDTIVSLLDACELADDDITLDVDNLRPLRACQLGFACELYFLQHQCERALRKAKEPDERAGLALVLDSINAALLDALIAFGDIAGKIVESNMLLGNNLLFDGIRDVLRIYFELPTSAEGGPPYFTLAKKVRGCENLLSCLQQMAWSYPSQDIEGFDERLSSMRATAYLEAGGGILNHSSELLPVSDMMGDLDWLLEGAAGHHADILSALAV